MKCTPLTNARKDQNKNIAPSEVNNSSSNNYSPSSPKENPTRFAKIMQKIHKAPATAHIQEYQSVLLNSAHLSYLKNDLRVSSIIIIKHMPQPQTNKLTLTSCQRATNPKTTHIFSNFHLYPPRGKYKYRISHWLNDLCHCFQNPSKL